MDRKPFPTWVLLAAAVATCSNLKSFETAHWAQVLRCSVWFLLGIFQQSLCVMNAKMHLKLFWKPNTLWQDMTRNGWIGIRRVASKVHVARAHNFSSFWCSSKIILLSHHTNQEETIFKIVHFHWKGKHLQIQKAWIRKPQEVYLANIDQWSSLFIQCENGLKVIISATHKI